MEETEKNTKTDINSVTQTCKVCEKDIHNKMNVQCIGSCCNLFHKDCLTHVGMKFKETYIRICLRPGCYEIKNDLNQCTSEIYHAIPYNFQDSVTETELPEETALIFSYPFQHKDTTKTKLELSEDGCAIKSQKLDHDTKLSTISSCELIRELSRLCLTNQSPRYSTSQMKCKFSKPNHISDLSDGNNCLLSHKFYEPGFTKHLSQSTLNLPPENICIAELQENLRKRLTACEEQTPSVSTFLIKSKSSETVNIADSPNSACCLLASRFLADSFTDDTPTCLLSPTKLNPSFIYNEELPTSAPFGCEYKCFLYISKEPNYSTYPINSKIYHNYFLNTPKNAFCNLKSKFLELRGFRKSPKCKCSLTYCRSRRSSFKCCTKKSKKKPAKKRRRKNICISIKDLLESTDVITRKCNCCKEQPPKPKRRPIKRPECPSYIPECKGCLTGFKKQSLCFLTNCNPTKTISNKKSLSCRCSTSQRTTVPTKYKGSDTICIRSSQESLFELNDTELDDIECPNQMNFLSAPDSECDVTSPFFLETQESQDSTVLSQTNSCILGDDKIRSEVLRLEVTKSLMSNYKASQKILYSTIDELCSTIGQLSNQINDIILDLVSEIDNKKKCCAENN